MTPVFRVVIPGRPITKKNSGRLIRAKGRVIPIPSKAVEKWTRAAVKDIRAAARRAGLSPMAWPVSMRALFFRSVSVDAPGDLQNYINAACDALQHGGAVTNDQFIRAHDGSRLRYDKARPRVEITLSVMDERDA